MLSAIEIYNKPNFEYRVECFSILAVNAWELLLKAQILKNNQYKLKSIWALEPKIKKDKTKSSTRKIAQKNRSGNSKTIDIYSAIAMVLNNKRFDSLRKHLDTLIELRDNSIHFINISDIQKQVQEIGFACVKNYIDIVKIWELKIDLSQYNFYLMPLAYIDSQTNMNPIFTKETKNYMNFVKECITKQESNSEFNIAIQVKVDFLKGNSFEGIPIYYDKGNPNSIPIELSEENIKSRYPLTHDALIMKCKERYSDFKQGTNFNEIMKSIKQDSKLYHSRKLDPDNQKSPKKPFYNTNVFKILDIHFSKKNTE